MITFDASIHAAQRTFRTLLDALAHPGRVVGVADAVLDAPRDLSPALAAAALALFDRDVRVWVAVGDGACGEWLRAHTGCLLERDPRAAAFAVVRDAEDALPLTRWNLGTAEDPEFSTTLLVQVAALRGGVATTLRGPGIEREIAFAPDRLPAAFWNAWDENAARYPLGVDCFMFDTTHVAGLPRTSRAERA